MRPIFTLIVVTTEDGFIARKVGHTPTEWVSPEEQVRFLEEVEAADWAIMGRHTHEAVDRPDRRRIVLSTSEPGGWRRPTQLWVNPGGLGPDELPALVAEVHPARRMVILGGVPVHDWFLRHGAIDAVHLTVEPVQFGTGLPVLSGRDGRPPEKTLAEAGFVCTLEKPLNANGTRYSVWRPRGF